MLSTYDIYEICIEVHKECIVNDSKLKVDKGTFIYKKRSLRVEVDYILIVFDLSETGPLFDFVGLVHQHKQVSDYDYSFGFNGRFLDLKGNEI